MSFNVIEQFDEVFKDIDSLDQSKMEKFLNDTLQFFASLQETLAGADETERQKALDLALTLQNKLEDFAKQALTKTGLDADLLGQLMKGAGESNGKEYTAPTLKK